MSEKKEGVTLSDAAAALHLEQQDDALERIMRHAMHSATLDIKSAQRALAELYHIARECRHIEE